MSDEKLLVLINKKNSPSVFCIVDNYGSEEKAIEVYKKYRLEGMEKCEENSRLYPSQKDYWLKQFEYYRDNDYKIMTWDYFFELQNKFYSSFPVVEITEVRYYEMLEVLPPLNWQGNSFFMSEFTNGSWTTQFLKKGEKYYECLVDYHNKKTWIQNRMENEKCVNIN